MPAGFVAAMKGQVQKAAAAEERVAEDVGAAVDAEGVAPEPVEEEPPKPSPCLPPRVRPGPARGHRARRLCHAGHSG